MMARIRTRAFVSGHLTAALLIMMCTSGHAITIYDEFVGGDLSDSGAAPTSLGVLAAGLNTVYGRKDTLADLDILTFNVPSGHELTSVIVQTLSAGFFTDFATFTLYPGSIVSPPELELINLPASFGAVDLLQFDSAPGPQPAGDYLLRVSLVVLDIPVPSPWSDWGATFVVTPMPVPVPAAAWLFAAALGGLSLVRRRAAIQATEVPVHPT